MPELIVLELRAEPALARFAGPSDLADALAVQVVAVADWLAWCGATQTDPTAPTLVAFARQTRSRLVATPYHGEAFAPLVRHRLVLVTDPIGRSGWPGMHLTGYTRDPDEPALWEPVLYAPSAVEVAPAAARTCKRAAVSRCISRQRTRAGHRWPTRCAPGRPSWSALGAATPGWRWRSTPTSTPPAPGGICAA